MDASKVKLSALNRAVHTSLLETSADAEMPTISMQDGFRWMSSVPERLLCFFRLCAIATFTAIVSVRMLTDVRGATWRAEAAECPFPCFSILVVASFRRAYMLPRSVTVGQLSLPRGDDAALQCRWSSLHQKVQIRNAIGKSDAGSSGSHNFWSVFWYGVVSEVES